MSSTAPEWLTDRTTTFEFSLDSANHAKLEAHDDVTVAVDGTTNEFTGNVSIASTGEIEASLGNVGTLDAPFGLETLGAQLGNVNLGLAYDGTSLEGTLGFEITLSGHTTPFTVDAGLKVSGGSGIGRPHDRGRPQRAGRGDARRRLAQHHPGHDPRGRRVHAEEDQLRGRARRRREHLQRRREPRRSVRSRRTRSSRCGRRRAKPRSRCWGSRSPIPTAAARSASRTCCRARSSATSPLTSSSPRRT